MAHMTRGFAVLAIGLFVLLAGCASDSAGTKGASASPTTRAPPPPAPAPNASEEFGSIAGSVLDEEQRPIARASVSLIEAAREVETDANGQFTFNELTPGKYALVVTRVGYDEVARKVEARLGEVTNVTVVLVAFEILEPFHETYDRVAFIGFGNVFFNDGTWLINQSAVNGVVCEPCQFVNHIRPGPSAGVTETLWLAGQSGVPFVNADAWVIVKRNWTTGAWADGTNVVATYFSDRERVAWGEAVVKDLKIVDRLMIQVHGGVGVNVQHKIQIFNSMSYNGPFPDDFTALPPP